MNIWIKKISLVLIILLLSGCGYDMYKMPDDAYIYYNDNIFDVFSDHTVKDMVLNTNVEVIFDDKKIDTDKIGSYSYTIEYNFNKKRYKEIINYSVVDNVKPVFIGASNELEILVNSDSNICDKIVFGDNYDSRPWNI